ncbi:MULTISPECIES: long-chain fatty acid--CoA ligase [unclassified Leptospira]|uniref:AMP-dependent synthetase/ligase n=1 Tax=unclassified Leptospira TaxID=2633828 RepID=UPI00029282A5|nr:MULTISPECIES: long-chain fatty acid--CoA ligase [unclassified Leptospira]EKO80122.1 AMP-binding enzyme [Leptospira sp. Fiocruz LV3954]EMI67459.1 AMP-binding enzyme [Leptospira sp. Fiocruz LV4135]
MYKNLADMFIQSTEQYGDRPVFWSKGEDKEFYPTSYKQLYDIGIALAEALIDIGLKAREHVGVLADNRLEWMITDYAVQFCGAANVPRGVDVTESELEYILQHSEAKIVFIENDKMLDKFNKVKSKLPKVETIIVMDKASAAKGKNIHKIYDLVEEGKALRAKGSRKAEKRIEDIKPEDLFTLIYTSGTTGMPKGVMLMHSNMVHQMVHVVPMLLTNTKPTDSMLSILPIWHIFERVNEYGAISRGIQTYYTKVTDLKNDLTKAKPSFMGSAPRVWENVYTNIYNKVNDPKQTPPLRKFLFKLAYFFSKHYNASRRFLNGLEVDYENRNILKSVAIGTKSLIVLLLTGPFTLSAMAILAYLTLPTYGVRFPGWPFLIIAGLGLIFNAKTLDAIVLSKIRAATGGRLKGSLSGGGALQSHVDNFFNDIGMLVLEGYGMTETSPVISVRPFAKPIIGSVGFLVPKSELMIKDENGNVLTHINDKFEILAGKLGQKGVVFVKGPQVMKGYYKNPEVTKKTIADGWMNTGDIGFINFKKTLTLTGRAKDTVVLLGGENVEPVPIENKMDESPFIKQSMVIGQDKKVLGAIIVPDMEQLTLWCKENEIDSSKIDDLIKNPKVIDFYKKEVRNYNSTKTGFKSFEQVQHIILAKKPFEVGDELTNLLKMKRHVITEKYSKEIKKIYDKD